MELFNSKLDSLKALKKRQMNFLGNNPQSSKGGIFTSFIIIFELILPAFSCGFVI